MSTSDTRPGADSPMQEPQVQYNQNTIATDQPALVVTLSTQGQKPLNEFHRFAMMTAACFAAICASTSYAFNLFSGAMQTKWNFSTRDMSNINTVGMVFCYFLLPYGTLFDMFGPRIVYTIGCVLFPLGALLLGLTFQGVLEGSVVRFCVYNALLSLGSQLFDLATVITMLSVFPTRKGWVVAFLKTLMGLGSSILAAIWLGFFSGNPSNYFYFLIGLVVVVGVSVQLLIKLPPYHLTKWERKRLPEEEQQKRLATRAVYILQHPPMFRFYYGITLICILTVYLPLMVALTAFLDWNGKQPMIIAIIAIIITVCLLFMMMPWGPLDRMTTAPSVLQQTLDNDEVSSCEPIEKEALGANREDISDELRDELSGGDDIAPAIKPQPAQTPAVVAQGGVQTDIDYIAPAYQTTFLESLCTVRLWCIFWTMFCGVGSEFVIIFNARFIYGALDGALPDETVATLLTVLNGAGSAIGRMAMSVFEMKTQNRPAEKRIPITAAFFIPSTCIIVAIILFLVLPGRSMLVAFAIASLGNGFCASVTVLVIQTIYCKDPAKHYNFGYNALWVSGILLNRLLYGEWAARRAEKNGQKICLGKGCVLMPLVVMLGINVSAFASNVYIHLEYVRYSHRVLAERARVKREAQGEVLTEMWDGEVETHS